MQAVCSPYFDPEFDSLPERIYGPACRVCIDNESLDDCTLVKVDSVNQQGLLLVMVQVLTDLNLTITKSYISCDGGWFMDVFHVKDENGNKLTDDKLNFIQQAIESSRRNSPPSAISRLYSDAGSSRSDDDSSTSSHEHTAIEMTGTDRPGLFSEISAALADLHCNIVEAHAWSHNACLACVAYISDQFSDSPIDNPDRLAVIETHLTTVLRASTNGSDTPKHYHYSTVPEAVKTNAERHHGATEVTNVERRLHQLMVSVRDFDGPHFGPDVTCRPNETVDHIGPEGLLNGPFGGKRRKRSKMVTIERCDEKGYSIVTIRCRDRLRLMFDTVCTLTDLQYMIFHASIAAHGEYAFQEYFIRHVDGRVLDTELEKDRVIKCLEAAIERRVCEGVRLELRAHNRVGLLSDITRVLRENGLSVVRADVETHGDKSVNAFYVKNIAGNVTNVDGKVVELIKKEVAEPVDVKVNKETMSGSVVKRNENSPRRSYGSSFTDILKSKIERLSQNFSPTK